MQISATLNLKNRSDWRTWLLANHKICKEVWLVRSGESLTYLDTVEEALCFGWIDGIAKKTAILQLAQRFTPRRPGGNWTELNKARAQRLIRLGLMTEAGSKILPSLELRQDLPEHIFQALSANEGAIENFKGFSRLYRAVRIGYIEEVKAKPLEYEKRLNNFVAKTVQNKLIGNWDDSGRLCDSELIFA